MIEYAIIFILFVALLIYSFTKAEDKRWFIKDFLKKIYSEYLFGRLIPDTDKRISVEFPKEEYPKQWQGVMREQSDNFRIVNENTGVIEFPEPEEYTEENGYKRNIFIRYKNLSESLIKEFRLYIYIPPNLKTVSDTKNYKKTDDYFHEPLHSEVPGYEKKEYIKYSSLPIGRGIRFELGILDLIPSFGKEGKIMVEFQGENLPRKIKFFEFTIGS